MSFLGCMGRPTAGSGLQQLLEVDFAQNSVTHVLIGNAIARAVRGHFLADAILIAELYRVRVATKCKTYRSVQCRMQKQRNAYNLQDSPGCIASNHDLVLSFTQGMF